MSADPTAELRVEKMMQLFDYHTYNLFLDNTWVGQVTVNTSDRSVRLTLESGYEYVKDRVPPRVFASWVRWINAHRSAAM